MASRRATPTTAQAPGIMGGKPATLPAGKASTSTQSDWAAKDPGTPYRLFHVPALCACPPLEEVDSKTMESRLVKGLYFAGEVLDIDGDSGGYDLQAAWSTAALAAHAMKDV